MNQKCYDVVLHTPVGWVGIVTDGAAVTRVDLGLQPRTPIAPRNTIAARAVRQLEDYFEDPSRHPEVPLAAHGTPFCRRVWAALRGIPPGHTRTYGELARELGSSARAVGGACRANPCPIFIPCHRVIASSGKLGGFSGHRDGAWLEIKRGLLSLEGAPG